MNALPDETLCANLSPSRIVNELAGPEKFFAELYEDTQFLLIKLQPAVDELERGLVGSDPGAGDRVQPSVRAMAFETASLDLSTFQATLIETAAQGIVRHERLRWLLRNDRWYVAPLRKRSHEESFRDRVSLGRAVNRDIVLRHANVSKLHAWFELDDTGNLYVADAGSSNGTYLNASQLPARELTKVQPGSHLRFGAVEALVCGASQLWRAVRH